ncbi:hypothetical protein BD626DRAFT_525790 [Schizophyllum amplum]|uniref:Uncharacterized protein n=1 Tax=Schizophyllum amplum TaxID=97359 RepID=A0A550BSF1_9AGAR|nr:hypothetical protein BD626DRAFT_525790 [Auriculariopsis ampla]
MDPVISLDIEAMFPEFDQVKLMSEAAAATDRHYFSLVRLLWDAYERRDLPDNPIEAFSQVFLAAQNGIRCSDEALDDTLVVLNAASDSVTDFFDILCKSGANVFASLSALEYDALATLSYPPVIHYAIVHVIGAQWTDRQYALTKVTSSLSGIERAQVSELLARTAYHVSKWERNISSEGNTFWRVIYNMTMRPE